LIYASAAVNWFGIKVNQFSAARSWRSDPGLRQAVPLRATTITMHKLISKAIFVILIVLVSFQSCTHSKSEYNAIMLQFEHWKADQYLEGIYATEDDCSFDSVSKEDYKGPTMGIPDDLDISYTDINGDSKLDAIIVFNPVQCDGGNALMNVQIRVLVLSGKAFYTVDDVYFKKIESRLDKGWLIIDKAVEGSFYGTYFEYRESDGRCCPSIRRPVLIEYKTQKLEFLNP
jgi:hypothetical protein